MGDGGGVNIGKPWSDVIYKSRKSVIGYHRSQYLVNLKIDG